MIEILQPLELVKKNMIVKHMSGSHAYGMATAESDVDIRGVFLADPINIRTPFFKVEECTIQDEEDTKFYEGTHFMKLLLQNNPNIVETLWMDDADVLFVDDKGVYDLLKKNRYAFLSSKVAHTYTGYAFSQIKRHTHYNKQSNKLNELDVIFKEIFELYNEGEMNLEDIKIEFGDNFYKYFESRL